MSKLKKLTQILIQNKASKIEIAIAYVWYHFTIKESEISLNEINKYFIDNALPKYNQTYLKEDLRKNKNVTKGTGLNTYKPVRKYQDDMESLYSFVITKSEEIITDDIILPDSLLHNTRGYIEIIGKQINASYNNNIFDGCAVLMRRLLEILLIHSHDECGRLSDITDGDGYRNLSYIINYTISNKPFKLSKEASETIDDFRQVGNFAAHKIQFNTKRKDIDNIRLKYRLTIEELLYSAKMKK
ncbi:MAG: hypothetical protein NTW29_14995 [Bacteroidetes bacterium]|nr:hypothetical protein [Bacteroidota bacterium]